MQDARHTDTEERMLAVNVESSNCETSQNQTGVLSVEPCVVDATEEEVALLPQCQNDVVPSTIDALIVLSSLGRVSEM